MRSALVDALAAAGAQRDFGFIAGQVGMFSYCGLSAEQMQRLRAPSTPCTARTPAGSASLR